MIERERYDVVITALKLACDELKRSNIEVTKENMKMLEYKINGSIMGYYLMLAEELLKQKNV